MSKLIGGLVVLGLALLQFGCSDEAVGRPDTPPAATEAEPAYGLKVWVGADGASPRLVTIGPAGPVSPAPNADELELGDSFAGEMAAKVSEQPSTEAPGLQPLATIGDGTGTSLDTSANDERYGFADGWTLAHWAIKSCVPASENGTIPGVPFSSGQFGIAGAPWAVRGNYNLGGYYFFYWDGYEVDHSRNCDKALFMQETLLCAADRLAQIADSPGTATWTVPSGVFSDGTTTETEPPITVTIPPQAAQDVFVAREMALNILAHINGLDHRTGGSNHLFFYYSCNAIYSRYAEGDLGDRLSTKSLKYTPYYDAESFEVDADHVEVVKSAALRRLTRKAMMLASSARLAQQLVEKSIEQDLAGAQQFLTAGGTSLTAARRAWGVEEGQSPANTFRHAVKTLFGRLEIGNHRNPEVSRILTPNFVGDQFVWTARENMRDDPRCNGNVLSDNVEGAGQLANDSLFALRGGTSARWRDAPPSSPKEAYALSLLHGAGIVFPPSLPLSDEQLSGEDSVIVAELTRQAAMRAKPGDVTSESAVAAFVTNYRASEFGRALAASLSEIKPGEWRFAIARAFGSFRLMAHRRHFEEIDPVSSRATLEQAAGNAGIPLADAASSITGAGGVVVVRGLRREEASSDVMAPLGLAQHNANCGVHNYDTNWPNREIDSRGTSVLGFQNAFLLGQTLERQLAELEHQARTRIPDAPQLEAIADFARASSAEARAWAGPGFMTRYAANRTNDDPADLPATYSVLEFVNVSFEDLGVEDSADLLDRLVLTQHSSEGREIVQAECLAGLRSLCPTISETPAYVLKAAYFEEDDITDLGLHHPILRVKFGHLSDLSRYAVIRSKNGRPGQVLGFLPGSSSTSDRFVEVISRRQRELAKRVFGLPAEADITRTCSSVPPLAMPSEYCIDGMTREQFVPLANSITSSGSSTEDSFKHYLDVAEQAAARADELGRQLIELGLQRDIRSEAAAEEVSQICGVYPDDAVLTQFSGSAPSASTDDPALQACIAPEKVDVVFLRQDLAKDSGKSQNELCEVFCGANGEQAPFCRHKCENGERKAGTPDITTDSFGLVSDPPPAAPSLDSCTPIVQSFQDGKADLSKLDEAIEAGRISATSLALALSSLRLEERDDGQWMLLSGGRPVMGTSTLVTATLQSLGLGTSLKDVWPLCGATCSERAQLLGQVFAVAGDNTTRYPALRRQVERSLFFMGAMAGSVPEGTFQVPLLAVDRDTASGQIAVPAFYAPARFAQVGTTGRYRPIPAEYLGAGESYPLAADKAMPDVTLPSAMAFANFLQDRQSSKTLWRKELFESAIGWRNAQPASVLVTAPVGNAMLRFDARLDPNDSTSTRDNLGTWLRRIFGDYQNGSLLPTRVQQAALFRALDQDGSPLRFCARAGQDGEFFDGDGRDLVHGRQICTAAPTSPVFYSTAPTFDPVRSPMTDSCHENVLPGHLFSTHVARAVDKGKAYAAESSPGEFEWVKEWEIGWFRLFPTVGIERREGCEVEGDDYCLDAHEDGFSWSQIVPSSCSGQKLWTIGEGDCEHQGTFYNGKTFTYGATEVIAHDRLRPDICSPAERVELFIETDVVEREEDKIDPRHAVEVLVRALTLACSGASAVASPDVPPPPVNTIEDMLYLEAWTGTYAASVWQSAGYLYLVDVPQVLLDVMKGGGANANAVAQGSQGQALLELEKNVRLVESSIAALGVELGNLSRAISEARVGIRGIELEAKGEALRLKLARVEYARQAAVIQAAKARAAILAAVKTAALVAAAAVACVGTAGAACVPAGVGLAAALATSQDLQPYVLDFAGLDNPDDINAEAASQSQGLVDEQAEVGTQLKHNRIDQALIALNGRIQGTQQLINGHLTGLGNSVSSALQDIGRLQQGEAQASMALAKAAGSDFVELGSQDKMVPLHVNTVYRRQFDITLQRYQQALASAKRAAYLARLAVEERLGVRMDDLHEAIGPLEAPSLWADNICTVQGVDYNKLREAQPVDEPDREGKELDLIRGFANQYVGDYVAQLREFVEFYNLQFPFADAQDVALISLRSDVHDPGDRCFAPSPNLLFYSDQLHVGAADVARGPNPSQGGWNVTGCDAAYCTEAASGDALLASTAEGAGPLVTPTPGAATWLHTRERSTATVSSEEAATGLAEQEPPLKGKPAGFVFQTVELEAGQEYLLTWWDQARAANGDALAMPTIGRARAGVFDSQWNHVALETFETRKEWSDRRVVSVLPSASGIYHVGFAPALAGAAGSVVIANVQLERLGRGNGGPLPYASNAGSRIQFTADCVTDPGTFLSRFDYKCQKDGCWHVLREPLFIDTEALNQGGSTLVGKLAQGNFNYRLGGVAVNLVGTGLRDCSDQGAACYGTGYVEYDLEHAAYNVPLEDYANRVSCFDFGQGAIRSGKALAIERFLTLPLGSADRELVSTAPFLKSELSGRPLSGTYRLRIKDSPGLMWSALEDIQLVVNYSYWSRVDIARAP